jgi:hypothetical protein
MFLKIIKVKTPASLALLCERARLAGVIGMLSEMGLIIET